MTTRKTPAQIMRVLSETFHDEHPASVPNGLLRCPLCHDALDVRVVGPHVPTGLRRFHCRVCAYNFSSVVSTPFSSQMPLPRMAYAALGAPASTEWPFAWRGTHRNLAARVSESPFVWRWCQAFTQQGISPSDLLHVIDSTLHPMHAPARAPRTLQKGRR